MERKQQFEIAQKLINARIEYESTLWADNPEKLRTYAIHCLEVNDKRISVQPMYETTFYTIEEYIDIARVCHMSFYVSVEPNQHGQLAPTLNVYYA